MSKSVLVTGGSRGIGAAVCESLARYGATVVVGYRHDAEAAHATLATVTAQGARGAVLPMDVTDTKQAQAAVDQVAQEYGRLDGLVNCAGVSIPGLSLPATPIDDWRSVIDTNLTGAYVCTAAAAYHMLLARGGSIVNVSSIAALQGLTGAGAYCASKAGLHGLTRALAKEYGRHQVRVNAVVPGYTAQTGMVGQVGAAALEELTRGVPLGRLADGREIADAVSFLLSDLAGYITGQCLVVDGGLTA